MRINNMLFSSLEFLFFLPIIVVLYFLLKETYRNAFLVCVSLLFYAWGEPKFVIILVGMSLLNYFLALMIDKCRNRLKAAKALLVISLICNIGVLFIFKYTNFAVANVNRFFGMHLSQTNIMLPIGISFFTFKTMSYVIDVYRGRVPAQKNVLNVGLYISFFPQLLAGPIVRYESVAGQLEHRTCKWSLFCDGATRFTIGICKKVLLANNLAIVANKAFSLNASGNLSVAFAWLGAVCYTLQIYYDFSGYSDMAIGLGKIFGFDIEENFNYPYVAKSITDFWRRWHISLSAWFRDYVYFPLGGSKVKSSARHILNLFIVWALTGLWHGAQWNFITWGIAYFLLLTAEKYLIHPESLTQMGKALYRVFTLLCVVICWVLFRAEGMHAAADYLLSMFGLRNNTFGDVQSLIYAKEYIVFFLLGIIFSTPILAKVMDILRKKVIIREIISSIGYICLGMLFLLCIAYLVQGSYSPFIYFNF